MFPLTTDCPLLRTFSSSLPVTPDVVAFIARHPKLERLILVGRVPEDLPGPVHLPNLTYLKCPSDLVSSLAPGSPLSHVGVIWGRLPSGKPEVILKSLAESTTPITSLRCYRWNWFVDVFPYVSQNLGRLEHLSFMTHRPSSFAKKVSLSRTSHIALGLTTYFSGVI